MAFLQVIRNIFIPFSSREADAVVPAPPTSYSVLPLAEKNLDDVIRLNFRCFENGENYTKHTFSYLLSQHNSVCLQVVTAESQMVAFLCVLLGEDGTGHITTIGVAPEHRRRGLGELLLGQLDEVLFKRGIRSVVLEVRNGNTAAQNLYKACGFTVVQRLAGYYNNGEDALLMVKALNNPPAH